MSKNSQNRVSILNNKPLSFKIIVIGQSSTGKTSIIRKYIHGDFVKQYNVTVGVDFSSKTVEIGQQYCQLQIWDTCGQDVYHSITKSFYRGACGVFLVYSINDRESFKKAGGWIDKFKQQGSPLAFIFLIGAKCDLERKVSRQQAAQFLKKVNGAFFIQTSSLTGQNVGDLFNKAANLMYKNYEISNEFKFLVNPEKGKQNINLRRASYVQAFQNQQNTNVVRKKKCCN